MTKAGDKQVVHGVIKALEEYLIEFIKLARSKPADIDEKRAKLFAAIDAAIDASDG